MSDATPKLDKKPMNWVLVLVPVAVVAALVLAFTLPPSHALIVNGPLKPLFARIGLGATSPKGAHVSRAADPAADVKRLGDELDAGRKTAADKDARIAQLQSQVAALQAPSADAAASPAPAPKPSATAVSEDIKRTAAYWAGMDADKAADVAKQLPDDYVRRVFGQMPADAVAEIMNAMPAKSAAKLIGN